jgi:F0F1-type ATP synthase gamma subunit
MGSKGLAKLKAEMLFNADLTRLVDVMKGISTSQYFVVDRRRVNLTKINDVVENMFKIYDFRNSQHPFVRLENSKRLIGVVATDSGFTGGLNMKVAQAAFKLEQGGSYYFALGERGWNYLKEFSKPHQPFPGINPDETRFRLASEITAYILREVLSGNFGHVVLVYPRALNFSSQRIESVNLIPCPMFFKDRETHVVPDAVQAKSVILDSPADGIIEYLTAVWIRKRLLEIFEQSKLAEYGARTMHLEGSYQTLTKDDKQLKLQFFKARREKIDQSLRETFTSQLLCSKR